MAEQGLSSSLCRACIYTTRIPTGWRIRGKGLQGNQALLESPLFFFHVHIHYTCACAFWHFKRVLKETKSIGHIDALKNSLAPWPIFPSSLFRWASLALLARSIPSSLWEGLRAGLVSSDDGTHHPKGCGNRGCDHPPIIKFHLVKQEQEDVSEEEAACAKM